MPVLNVIEDWSNRTGEESDTDARAAKGYTVLTTLATDNQIDVLGSPLVIQRGNSFDVDHPHLICRHRAATPIGPLLWQVIADFTGRGGLSSDPIALPAEIRWGAVTNHELVEHDVFGRPYLNAVDQPFAKSRRIKDYRLEVRRAYLSIDGPAILDAIGGVNIDFFFTAAGRALLDDAQMELVHNGDFNYWDVYWLILFRKGLPFNEETGQGGPARAWWGRVAQKGTRLWNGKRYRLPSDPPQGPFTGRKQFEDILSDDFETRITDPVYITTDGRRVIDPREEPVHWIETEDVHPINFSQLNIL